MMDRRGFLRLVGGAAAAGTVAACVGRASTVTASSGRLDAAAFHAARRFAATPSGKIAYVERGAGGAALFLHGFPLNGFQWRGALERLSPYRRCIAPNFLAMGHTEVGAGQSVDPAAQVAMLVALLDTLGIQTADVVANDSGGTVAQLLVARCPERVRSLLLTNCDVEGDRPRARAPGIERSRRGELADQWLGAWRRDQALVRSSRGIGGMCYADPSQLTDEAIETYFAPLVASDRRKALVHDHAIALERNPLAGTEYPLGCAMVPTRIVWGTADTMFSSGNPDYLDRTVGNSLGVRRLHGAKLFWPEERPDVVAEEARALWAR